MGITLLGCYEKSFVWVLWDPLVRVLSGSMVKVQWDPLVRVEEWISHNAFALLPQDR